MSMFSRILCLPWRENPYLSRDGGTLENSIVFEDSIHGLNAGRASGAFVVGLATSNPREVIEPLCDLIIDSFEEISYPILKQIC